MYAVRHERCSEAGGTQQAARLKGGTRVREVFGGGEVRLSAGDTARVPSAVQSYLYTLAVLVTHLECMERRCIHERAFA